MEGNALRIASQGTPLTPARAWQASLEKDATLVSALRDALHGTCIFLLFPKLGLDNH